MLIKRMMKRNWRWYNGSGVQKDLHIKNLERIIVIQDKRLSILEELVVRGGN